MQDNRVDNYYKLNKVILDLKFLLFYVLFEEVTITVLSVPFTW